ncbi:hypothetical protein [Nocardia sp. CNY236]|uniref:hypothetical protein n=1 Tax=Nocardia sp. CNY236 TaxID=1169152 RepID=UPI00350ECB1E
MTLVLAAIGCALLIAALVTGAMIWAWGCIVVCSVGAALLLVSALSVRRPDNESPPSGHKPR